MLMALPSQNVIVSQVWDPPDKGSVKLNCDDAWKGEVMGGVGVVVMDDGGSVLTISGGKSYGALIEQSETTTIRNVW